MKQHSIKKKETALIVFTREPTAGKTKTRMMPYYESGQCADLHLCFIRDIYREIRKIDADIIVSYTGGDPIKLRSVFGESVLYTEQKGDDLGLRMYNALKDVFEMEYEKVLLIGTDIPELRAESVEYAFSLLEGDDVVLGPTADGGYYLVGMKSLHEEAFDVKHYGGSTVLDDTVRSLEKAGLSIALTDTYHDMDDRDDLAGYLRRMRTERRLRSSETGKFIKANAKISIIVPVYNEAATIRRMCDQLMQYRSCAEIFFVDGGSTDDTVKIIGDKFPVLSGVKGRAAQMNQGAEKSSGDILFFLHCDSILPPKALDEIRECIAENEYGCFGVKFASSNFFMLTNRVISNHRAWSRGLPFGDQGIFIGRELFFDMGMFPDIPIMEDYEFSRRLLSAGIKPGRTRHRISTSARRYGNSTLSILKTEYKMWNLRKKYRAGTDIEEISSMYRDIR